MKKIILALLVGLTSCYTHAEIPKQFNVYVIGSTAVNLCRELFKLYDAEYNTSTVIIQKPGAYGLLAVTALHLDPNFAVECGGLNDLVFGGIQFPDQDVYNHLSVITMLGEYSILFTAGPKSTYSTLPELLRNKKSLLVGFSSISTKFIASKALASADITWIPFKSPNDAVASLHEGLLDLYVDGGAFIPLYKTGTLKNLGQLNGSNKSPFLNLNSEYPEATKFHGFMSVFTTDKTNQLDIVELNNRLTVLKRRPSFIKLLESFDTKPMDWSLEHAKEVIELFKIEARK
jgi:tripartite-type tricarboxylate transporter receptor subunit TctC